MNRNAPAVLALGAALVAIAALAFLSLADRERRTPTPPAQGPERAAPLLHGTPSAGTQGPSPAAATPKGSERDTVAAVDADAFTLRGTVRSSEGRPVVAAVVRMTLAVGAEERFVLGETITGADGKYTLASRTPLELVPERRGLAVFVATAVAEGYRPSTVEGALVPVGETQTIDLTLDTGGRLAGRVLDARGAPVAGCEVALVVSGSAPGRPELSAAQTTHTDADGRFALGFLSAGTVAVHARASGIGSALASEVALAAGTDVELGELALSGPGTLDGRVTYPDGAPARGLELWVLPAELAGRPLALTLAQRDVLARERGAGLTVDRTRTDDEGRFRFAGLDGESHTLVTGSKGQTLAPPAGTYATGTQDIALMLGARRLRVLVRSADERPLPGARVALVPIAEGTTQGARIAGPAQHAVAGDVDAACDFELAADVAYALRVTAPGCHPLDERILLGEAEHERLHSAVLHPATTSGTIRLDVRDERGEVLPDPRVWILAESTGLPVPGFDGVTPDANGRIGPLPPGRYGLAAWPRGPGAASDAPGDAFPVETDTPVEVAPHAETFVSLVARSGGRVRLTLDLPRGHALDDEDDEGFGTLTLRRRAARRLREHGAQATFVAEDGRALPVHFESEGGLELLLLPGTAGTVNDLLEPGRWSVRVEAPGFVPAAASVTIVPGEVVDVRIALEPR